MHSSEAMSRLAQAAASAALEQVTRCPLCHGVKHKLVCSGGGKSLKKCRRCGVNFIFPQPTPAELAEHFQDGTCAKKFDPETNRKRVLEKVARFIRERKPAGTILDVGCATGCFLGSFFGEAEWSRLGAELSNSSADEAEKRGLRVYRGSIRQASLAECSVDVATVLDAFYYFPEPQAELAELRRVLKEDGLLGLEMPVATSRILRLSGIAGTRLSGTEGSLFEESDHLFYYTPQSLSRLLEQCGFRVKKVVALPANRQDHWLRELLYRAYGFFSWTLQLLTRSRIFLGPRFLVLAEKYHANTVVRISDRKCEVHS